MLEINTDIDCIYDSNNKNVQKISKLVVKVSVRVYVMFSSQGHIGRGPHNIASCGSHIYTEVMSNSMIT